MAELSLGEALLVARRRKGWSQGGLARQASLSAATLFRVENDRTPPSSQTIRALDAALDGELVRLWGAEPDGGRYQETDCTGCGYPFGSTQAVVAHQRWAHGVTR